MLTIFKREILSYFRQPLAYVYLVVYLTLSVLFTFTFGRLVDGNQANLVSFFTWQPWLLLLLVPAVGMRLWSEEKRSGTAELLLTLPISPLRLVLGKFLAAWLFLALSLFGSATVALTVNWLGKPDLSMIASGYLGCLLLAGCFLAISEAISALSRDQLISYVISFAVCLLLVLAGVRPVGLLLVKWGIPAVAIKAVTAVSVLDVFGVMLYGLVEWRGLFLLLSLMALPLAANCAALPSPVRRRHGSWGGIILLAVLLAGANFLLYMHVPNGMDCTQDRLHTLSESSRSLSAALSVPATIRFYYSEDYPELSNEQMAFARRIHNMLRQYESPNLEYVRINPRTEALEAEAEESGCHPNVGSMGDSWYCSVVVESEGKAVVLDDLTPSREASFEYDVTRALLAVTRPSKPKIGWMGNLPLAGKLDVVRNVSQPSWRVFDELSDQFDMQWIPASQKSLPADIDVLMTANLKGISSELEDAIAAFVENGGQLLMFCDPLCKAELSASGRFVAATPAWLIRLGTRWGVEFSVSGVVADEELATPLVSARDGLQVHPTLLNATQKNFAEDLPFLTGLNSVKMFCSGKFDMVASVNGPKVVPLIWSSPASSMLKIYEAQRTAADILQNFESDSQRKLLSAMLDDVGAGHGRVVFFGDADMLHDSLCEENDGENPPVKLSDNIALVMNLAEFLSGTASLDRIRARSGISRPLDRIQRLAADTQRRVQKVLTDIQVEEVALEAKLATLKTASTDSPEQRAKILAERKALREQSQLVREKLYRRQRAELKLLRNEIDAVEARLLALNLFPALLALLTGIAVSIRRR